MNQNNPNNPQDSTAVQNPQAASQPSAAQTPQVTAAPGQNVASVANPSKTAATPETPVQATEPAAAPDTAAPVTAEPVVEPVLNQGGPVVSPSAMDNPAAASGATTPTQSTQQPEPASGSNLPLLLILLLIVLAAGAGAWWYFTQRMPVVEDEVVVEQPVETAPVMIEEEPTPVPEFDEVIAPPATNPAETTTEVEETEVRIIAIEAGNYFFAPEEIRVQQGETVRLELTSSDMAHNFIVDELDLSIPITNAGVTNSIEFTADEPGTYTYYCGVDGHREQGQVGQLIIE